MLSGVRMHGLSTGTERRTKIRVYAMGNNQEGQTRAIKPEQPETGSGSTRSATASRGRHGANRSEWRRRESVPRSSATGR